MHNLESIQVNETHKFPWYFRIQTDPRISAGLPELVIISKKKILNCGFCCPRGPQGKAERKLKNNLLDLAKELKKP